MLEEFISYLEEQIGEPYLWGGQHTKLTPSDYVSIINKREKDRGGYKDGTTYAEAAIEFCEKKFEDGAEVLYAYDCSGLGCYWLYNLQHLYKGDVSANTMMNRCEDLSDTDLPKKGWWVFRFNDSGSKASHIGYMIDDEYLIEAKGRKYGVVKTKFKAKDWDCWGVPKVFADEIKMTEDLDDSQDIVPDDPIDQPEMLVKVLGKRVRVRESDKKVAGVYVGKRMFTAVKGNKFKLIDIAPSGWYHIDTYKGPGYISNREDLTTLVEE